MSLTLTFVLEVLLCLLLAVTLIYCVILERRLSNVQKSQKLLGKTVRDLNVAIGNAGNALSQLKNASGSALGDLDRKVKVARALADELSVMTASGERIAERFDQAVASHRSDPRSESEDVPQTEAEEPHVSMHTDPPQEDVREEADWGGYRTRPRSGTETLKQRLDALRTVR